MKVKYHVARLIPHDPAMFWWVYSIELMSIGFDTELLAEEALSTQPSLNGEDKHYIIQKVYEI